jgi:hypothetical protein
MEKIMNQTFWTFVAAIGSLGAAGCALWYAILTRKTIRANLLSLVLTKYSSKERFEASKQLREFKDRNQEMFALCRLDKRPETAGTHLEWATHFLDEVTKIDPARGCLSAFFWEVKTYCKAGYLDKEMIAAALGNAGHELYLEIVEPLDWVHTKFILRRDDYDNSIRVYFEESAEKYFSRKFG